MRLPRKFYTRSTLQVAQDLLGMFLVRAYRGQKLVGKIVETEAYVGQDDLACHAAKGMTERNQVMFGPAGYVYVYMIYGMYNCLNIVTAKADFPAAVLIRAVEPVKGVETMKNNRNRGGRTVKADHDPYLTNGPGKLCQAMDITRALNGQDLLNDRIWIEDRGKKAPKKKITPAKRVGVDYAGPCKDYLWRFYVKGSQFVSK